MGSNINDTYKCERCSKLVSTVNKLMHQQFCLPDSIIDTDNYNPYLNIGINKHKIEKVKSKEINYKYCGRCWNYFAEIEYEDHLICHEMEDARGDQTNTTHSNNSNNDNPSTTLVEDHKLKQDYDFVEDAESARREIEEDEAFTRKLENRRGHGKKPIGSGIVNYLFDTHNRRAPPIVWLVSALFDPKSLVGFAVDEIFTRIKNRVENGPGTTEEDKLMLDLLPEIVVDDQIQIPEEKKDCIICMSTFKAGDHISALPCLHLYHSDCIKDWFKQNSTCPICKYQLTNEDFK